MTWDEPGGRDLDHDRDDHVAYRYWVIGDGYACTDALGWCRARAGETSTLVRRYRFLCSVDSHNRYVCVYARTEGNPQNVNVFSSGYESDDASCFAACRRGRIGSLGPRIEPTKMPESTTVRDVQQYCELRQRRGTWDFGSMRLARGFFGFTSATVGKPGTCLHVALYWSLYTVLRLSIFSI